MSYLAPTFRREILRRLFHNQDYGHVLRPLLDVKETNELSQSEYRILLVRLCDEDSNDISDEKFLSVLKFILKGHKRD